MVKLKPDRDIGKNLQHLRKRSGLTQDQVAAQMEVLGCKISRVTYAKMEASNYSIRISELLALKKIYKATYDEIFQDLDL